MNQLTIYSKPQMNKIFPEISFDNFNYNTEANYIIDDYIMNDNSEPFDKFFNDKKSNISSYDEIDYQKLFQNKSNQYTPTLNSEIKFNFNKKENIIMDNGAKNLMFENLKDNEISLKYLKNNNSNKIGENKSKNEISKKIIFNSFKPDYFTETQKQKKKINNKLSARKSRLKKKLYLEKLENELVLVKNELNEIKQKAKLNNQNKASNIEYLLNNKNLCDNCKHIDELKYEEKSIISQESINKNVNSFSINQRTLLEQLFIKQIQIMMPIKIKIFQNKYLKLMTINDDDTFNVIKNKIDKNIEALQELYEIPNCKYEDNGGIKINKCNIKGNSMPYQIYNFYQNLKNYLKAFEKCIYH